MRGQHRHDQPVIQKLLQLRVFYAGILQAPQRQRQAAVYGRPIGQRMRPLQADVVLVLRDVGQVREISKSAHDV